MLCTLYTCSTDVYLNTFFSAERAALFTLAGIHFSPLMIQGGPFLVSLSTHFPIVCLLWHGVGGGEGWGCGSDQGCLLLSLFICWKRRFLHVLWCNPNSCGFKSTTSKFLFLIPTSLLICPIITLGEIPLLSSSPHAHEK